MERRKPLQADPVKAREWQQRAVARYSARRRERLTQAVERPVDYGRREVPQKRSRNRKPRRNDGPWREQCLTRRGRYCRACHPVIAAGCVVPGHPIGGSGTAWNPLRLEVDHIKPRGQGGPSVVENGLVLCSEHHQAKTESRLLIRFEWLDPDQVAFLAAVGWCWWDDAGQPNGRGFKHFAANRAA